MTATATATPVVEHEMVVEIESDYGRYWSQPMPGSEVSAYIKRHEEFGDWLSDVDCTCLCQHPDHDSDPDFVRWRAEALAAQEGEDA